MSERVRWLKSGDKWNAELGEYRATVEHSSGGSPFSRGLYFWRVQRQTELSQTGASMNCTVAKRAASTSLRQLHQARQRTLQAIKLADAAASALSPDTPDGIVADWLRDAGADEGVMRDALARFVVIRASKPN
jgi:hypothetical protein